MMKRTMLWMVAGLLVAQAAYAEDEAGAEKNWWGGVSAKYWMVNYNSPSVASTSVSQIIPTLAVGYKDFFYTLSIIGNQKAGSTEYQEESSGFGYRITPNIAAVLGFRFFGELPPAGTYYVNRTAYQTVAGIFNWPLPDSKFILNGSLGYGTGKPQNGNFPDDNSNHPYTGVELGLSYLATDSVKVSAGYKSEKFDLPYKAINATVTTSGVAEKSGFYLGADYSF